MKERMRNLSARLTALTAGVILALVCVLTSGVTVRAAVENPYADVDFETYLTQQGFPESYKTELRKLHTLYPYWKFEAQHTNLDWNEAVEAESRLGMSLTENSNPSSWKSTQDGAYDWEKGEWISLDSGYWVAASKEILSYYMDPRNLLDETYIFQFLNQSYDAGQQTRDGVAAVTEGTFLSGSYQENGTAVSYIDTLLQAALESGVNPYTLASMIIIEQGADGTGNCISGTVAGYEGYYNYFDVGAYKTSTMDAVQHGLWYAMGSGNGDTSYYRPWNTRTKSIIGGAVHYGRNYIAEGQDTLYLKKFNVQGNNPYTHQYMTNVRGASIEAYQMSGAYTGAARNANLTFKIPVYLNMPETACVKPTGNEPPVKAEPEESGTQDVTSNPTNPDGDIILEDASGQVGDKVTVETTITTPSDSVSDSKVVISYDDNTLKLVESDGVSGGAGSAVVNQSTPEGSQSVKIPVTFEVLGEGTHVVKVESYEVKTTGEEMLTLTKGSSSISAVKAQTQETQTGETTRAETAASTGTTAQAETTVSAGTTAQTETAASTGAGAVSEGTTSTDAASVKTTGGTAAGQGSTTAAASADNVTKKEQKAKKNDAVDASAYDDAKGSMVSSVNMNVRKYLMIVAACMLAVGIGAGGIYFIKDWLKQRKHR